jgi:DNA-binding NarL/FixJ family response regulator
MTPREIEVLRLIAAGLTVKEVATRLGRAAAAVAAAQPGARALSSSDTQ